MFQTEAQKIKTHTLFSETPVFYEIMWKNIGEPDRPLETI
jgi:hypothetical protein